MRALRVISAICVSLLLGSCAGVRIFQLPTSQPCPKKCEVTVKIKVVADKEEIDLPDQLLVSEKPTRIYWQLPANYEFDTTQGDGVFLKYANDGEFSQMFETDDDNDNPSPGHRRAPRFHWRDANSKANPIGYEYKIQFRKSGSTKPLFKDPIIINSG